MADFPPKKNTAFVFYVSLISQANTKIAQVNPTLAAGDVKVATDDAAPGNLATLPVVDADFTKRVKVSLSAGEMNGDNVTVIFNDAAGAEWCDLTVNIQTVTRQLTDLAYPTVTGRSLDVSATGEAGLDWANIGAPTTAQNLSATNIDVDQIVASVSGAVGSVTGAVGSVTAGVTVTTNNDKTGYGLSAAAVQAVWDALTTALTTVGSIGKLLVDNVNAAISSRSSHSAADVWAAATRTLTAFGFGVTVTTNNDKTGYALTTAEEDAIVDKAWDELIAGHLGAGSTGAKLNAAGGAADPWATAIPGAYGAGTAGKIVGDNVNATISSRSTLAAADVRSAVGLAAANLDTQLTAIDDFIDTEVAAIKAVTDALPNAGALTTIQADLDDIQTRLPAALSGGNIKADVLAVNVSTAAAASLAKSAASIVRAAAVAGTLSTTQMTTDLTEVTDDHYNGRVIIWTSGVLLDQATAITDYTGATKMLAYTAITEAPTAGDTFIIV